MVPEEESSTALSGAAVSDNPEPVYAEDFVTRDAVYTVRSVDFVPPAPSWPGSIFDDPQDQIERTWTRTVEASASIASASEAEIANRVEEARKVSDSL